MLLFVFLFLIFEFYFLIFRVAAGELRPYYYFDIPQLV